MYAVVAVNASVRSGGTPLAASGKRFPGPVFHYHVPAELKDEAVPGTLVEVPFGARRIQGLVVALSDQAPVAETKPVTRTLFAEPVLSPAQIELGRWLSEHYFAPLIDCLRAMLPPGLLRRPRVVVRLHPEMPIPDDLLPSEREVVELVQRYGTLSPAQILRRLGGDSAHRAVQSLTRRGILVRGSDLPVPRARPKRVNFVRLRASPPQVSEARRTVGRHSKQAEVLEALMETEDPLPEVSQILALAGATHATLRTLAGKGWIELEPEHTLVVALPSVGATDLGRAHRQRAVLDYLGKQPGPVPERVLRDATGTSAATLRALCERGLVQRISEPARILMRLDDQDGERAIVELRGAARQHRVLDYLLSRPAGEWLWVSWVYAETGCALRDLRALEAHGLIELAEREVQRDPLADYAFALDTPPRLTPDQESAWAAIAPHLEEPSPPTEGSPPGNRPPPGFLLHGVTGSGKTEIYMRAADKVLQHGRRAIILVPEISMTPQTIRRFAARFPDGLGMIHSRLSDGERYDTWRRVRSGDIRLVVGPRSALFAPTDNLGLIVLDEEHSASYKQSDVMPPYHARDVAFHLAAMHRATVILGSATPDLATYHTALESGEIQLLELPQRILKHRKHLDAEVERYGPSQIRYKPFGDEREDVYAIDLPPVHIVDMRGELRAGNRSIFSRTLRNRMSAAVGAGEQVILFLNRRGASTFVMCRDCGTVVRCPRCDIPLTYHLQTRRLACHHCNYHRTVPDVCPICRSRRIRHFGVGTQRVEEAVRQLLPGARVLRWDRDTTRERGSHLALLDRFVRHQADVLIGTEMIAKGLDLPLVTLVGVVSADTALRLPDFRASERTFQLLAQVAGRAGRGPRGGQVVIQTYAPDHYAIQAAAQHNYAAFYAQELAFRRKADYPPFARLARLTRSDPSLARCRQEAEQLAHSLRHEIREHHLETVSLIGPAPCFLGRLRGRWRWQIILRGPRKEDALYTLLDRVPIPPLWRLDIDPLDML
jgi:primosomal protein N' (replication factor Y)